MLGCYESQTLPVSLSDANTKLPFNESLLCLFGRFLEFMVALDYRLKGGLVFKGGEVANTSFGGHSL